MKLIGAFQFGDNGDLVITGTSTKVGAINPPRKICVNKMCFFVGQFANLGEVDCFLQIQGWDSANALHTHHLRVQETIEVIAPLREINAAVNGSTILHGMGWIWECETPIEFFNMATASKLQEVSNPTTTRYDVHDEFVNTVFGIGGLADLVDPTAALRFILAYLQITVSAATTIFIRETNQANVVQRTLGQIVFGGSGAYDFPLPLTGIRAAAVGNKIRIESSAAATVSAFAQSREVET